jgi:hypothetical protein
MLLKTGHEIPGNTRIKLCFMGITQLFFVYKHVPYPLRVMQALFSMFGEWNHPFFLQVFSLYWPDFQRMSLSCEERDTTTEISSNIIYDKFQ